MSVAGQDEDGQSRNTRRYGRRKARCVNQPDFRGVAFEVGPRPLHVRVTEYRVIDSHQHDRRIPQPNLLMCIHQKVDAGLAVRI